MNDKYSKLQKCRVKFFELIETRHPCDVLRVRYWFQGLMQRVGSQSAYELEHEIEPRSFARSNGRLMYRGKWKGYEYGMNCPREKLQRAVDSRFPGSRYELNHPIWSILKKINSANLDVETWFEVLDPKLRLIVYKRGSTADGSVWIRKRFSKKLGVALVKQSSLDGLAALLLYWYESKGVENFELNENIAKLIFGALHIFCAIFYCRRIAYELFYIFKRNVLFCTKWESGIFGVDELTFENYVAFLAGILAANADRFKEDCVKDRVEFSYNVLYKFVKGFDVSMAMRIKFLPGWFEGPPTRSQINSYLMADTSWRWGWQHILRGTKGMVLDEELFEMAKSSRIEWRV